MDIQTENATRITPKQAELWLNSAAYNRQRSIRKNKVSFYSECMKSGRFYPTNTIAFATCAETRSTFLINGYHTLKAVVDSGVEISLPVIRHSVQNESDVDQLYAHYDIGQSRTFADAVKAYNASSRYGMSNSDINRISAAIKMIISEFPKTTTVHQFESEDIVIMISDWVEEYELYKEAVAGAVNNGWQRLYRASVLSVALVTMKYQQEKARVFWNNVALLNNVSATDPAAKLRFWLDTTLINSGSYAGREKVSNGRFSRTVAYCWNKYMEGVPIKQLRHSTIEESGEFVLAGTPLDGVSMSIIDTSGFTVVRRY